MPAKRKQHVPAPGWASGLHGKALCGRPAQYSNGDHALLRRLAWAACGSRDAARYCLHCLGHQRARPEVRR